MEPHNILFNRKGRLRSGWRLIIFLALFISLLFVFTAVARVAYALSLWLIPAFHSNTFFENVVFRGSLLFAALVGGVICNRWLERLPWRAIGISLHARWFRDFLIGSIIGIASLALAAAIGAAGGGLRFSMSGRELLWRVAQTLVVSAVLFIVAALAEEALFRGYPLQTLTREGLFWVGAILTSAAFVAVHVGNPNFHDGIPVINLALAGIWFAVAYWRTRSLWFPLGIHWAWNWALGSLFGLPVSGITEIAPYPVLKGTDLGPVWLTGGQYGIEGGIACTVAIIVSTIFVWRTRWVNASADMLKLTSGEIAGAGKTEAAEVQLKSGDAPS